MSQPDMRTGGGAWFGALLQIALALVLVVQAANAGTWAPVATTAPGSVQLMLLLTDGTVMCFTASPSAACFKLTPDASGSYVNGTWTALPSMSFTRRYFASQILQNGKVMAAGGEYGTGGSSTEVYDPVANTWTQVAVPGGLLTTGSYSDGTNKGFRDSGSMLLPNGTMLVAPVVPVVANTTMIYNPMANSWSAGPLSLGNQDEASWVKLPDTSIISVDTYGPQSERFIPSSNTWINDANATSIYGPGAEVGAGLLLPDGRVFCLGGNNNTAFYTPSGTTSPGTWSAGPVLPNGQACPDAPAAMLVNGKVFIATCPLGDESNPPDSHFKSPVSFYEFDPTSNTYSRQNGPAGGLTDNGISTYVTAMLCLPDGTILYSHENNQLYVYTPVATPLAAGKPTVNSIKLNADGSLHLTGTGFNGLSAGAAYGDDEQMDSNYPLVRFTAAGGTVRYGRSYNWSSTGVVTGTNIVTTECTVPAGASLLDTIQVVANGIASDSITLPVALETPTLTWTTGGTLGWRGENAVTHDGVDAAQSGGIGNSQSNYLEVTVTGPGVLTYWWKVSSETNYDYLRFTMDGNVSNSISGEVDWQLTTVSVPTGSHTLRWTYSKDVSVSVGADAGWLDQVAFISSEVANANDSGPGSLRQLITDVPAGATVTFAPNLSGAVITLTNGQLTLGKNLNIDGSALVAGIQVNGNQAGRVFEVNGGTTCVLTALTITNGYISGGFGGGVESFGNLTLNNCLVVGNRSDGTAGALAAYFGSLTLNQTTVAGNLGNNVSGIYIQDESATLNGCTLNGNSGAQGEALRLLGYYASASLSVINSTFSGNSVSNTVGSAMTIQQGNGSTASAVLTNCTVSANTVVQAGQPGAIYIQPGGSNYLSLVNTIVSGNISGGAPSDITGTAASSFNNLIGSGGGLVNGVNGNQVGINNPQLAALANNGSPTLTMLPLLGSPAIDAGGVTALSTDQRGVGYPRIVGSTSDIGAVEAPISPIVLTSADAGYGSLRYAIAYNPAGSSLTFDPGLSGQRITLTSGELVLNKNLTIDGSALPGGITLNGNHTDRVFYVASGSTVWLDSLTLSNGFYNGVSPGGYGGGIENLGDLTLNRCTLTDNSAGSSFGGAVENQGSLALNQCTLAGNSAQGGGGIASQAPLVVNQSTIAGNTGGSSSGIFFAAGSAAMNNSIVAGNGAGNIAGSFTGANNLTTGNPLLAPLRNYGGPTPTLPPFPGSPAVNAGGATSFATDQRGSGFPRVLNGAPDIGAVEGVFNPPIALNSPTRLGNGAFQFGFTNYSGLGFTVVASTNLTPPLGSWTVLGAAIEVTPGQYQFTDPQATNNPQRFYGIRLP